MAKSTSAMVIALLALVIALLFAGYRSIEKLGERMDRFQPITVGEIRDAIGMEFGAMLEAEWVDDIGITRRVVSRFREQGYENETEPEFQDRHDARVKAQLLRYPKP